MEVDRPAVESAATGAREVVVRARNDAIIAWRGWEVLPSREGWRLHEPLTRLLWPIGLPLKSDVDPRSARQFKWPNADRCGVADHAGIRMYAQISGRLFVRKSLYVFGEVALWGVTRTVVISCIGIGLVYEAEYAYPHTIAPPSAPRYPAADLPAAALFATGDPWWDRRAVQDPMPEAIVDELHETYLR